jgi:hypothetical protein
MNLERSEGAVDSVSHLKYSSVGKPTGLITISSGILRSLDFSVKLVVSNFFEMLT